MCLKTCHEILVLELIGDFVVSKGLVVSITGSNCWYNIIWKALSGRETMICTQQNKRRDIPWLCHNLSDWVFYTGTKNGGFLQ